MKRAATTCALGAAALLIGLAFPAAAGTAVKHLQLAQASDSGTQSGTTNAKPQSGNHGTSARTGSGGQNGATNTRSSEGQRAEGRRDVNVRANVNVRGGDRAVRNERRTGSRTTIRTRVGSRDNDVIYRRHHGRRYVYHEPSTVYIRRHTHARRYAYREPSRVIIRKHASRYVEGGDTVHHRRGGASVGVESRTHVGARERTNVRGSMTTRATSEHTSTGANVRASTRQGGNNGAMQSRSTSGRSGKSGQSNGENSGASSNRQ